MKQFSKVLLLSAVSLFVDSGNVTYASFEDDSSLLKSGIPTLHIHHTYIRHTLHGLDLSSRLFDDLRISREEQKVASVCFITDAGNCGADKFGNTETPNGGNGGGGNPDDHGTPEELCKQAGYTNTPCPDGSSPTSYCPYDSSYHSDCECSSEYNQVCDTALGEQGVGNSCGGKYKECCNLCSDYQYTSIPSGYVSNGECQSCDGKKYKIKCDPQKYVSGSSCGTQGGSGSTCSDDSGTYYQKCNCPNNYEWSDSQKKCVCATSFKYSCTGTGYAGGDGTACNSKYSKCKCASGYTWNASTGTCICSSSYKHSCSGTGYAGGEGTACNGKYSQCKCASGYVWNASQGACVCNGLDWCSLNQNCSAWGYAQQSCEGKSVKCPFNINYVYCLD